MRWVKELGADVVIDYKTQRFDKELSGYDVVLDSQGGETLARSLTVLKPGGLAIGIAGPPDPAFAAQLGKRVPLLPVMALLSLKTRRAAKRLGVRYSPTGHCSACPNARAAHEGRLQDSAERTIGCRVQLTSYLTWLSSLGHAVVGKRTLEFARLVAPALGQRSAWGTPGPASPGPLRRCVCAPAISRDAPIMSGNQVRHAVRPSVRRILVGAAAAIRRKIRMARARCFCQPIVRRSGP